MQKVKVLNHLYWFDLSFQVYRHSSYCGNPEKQTDFLNKTSITIIGFKELKPGEIISLLDILKCYKKN